MYKIQFVNDEEFEKLPGKDMYDKIGVAYLERGEAYVRESGAKIVDVFTAMHELEHLKGSDLDEHYDAENGCYYKGGFMNALGPIGTVLGSIFGGPVGGAIGGGIGGAGSSLFGGGQKQQAPQFNFQMPSGQDATSGMSSPNVIQAGQGAGGSGMSGSGFSPSGGLSGPAGQTFMQQFGNYAGKSPNAYNENQFGTPLGWAA